MPYQRDAARWPGLTVLRGVAGRSRSALDPHSGRAGTPAMAGDGDEGDASPGPDRGRGDPRLCRERPRWGDLLVVRRVGADPDRDRRGPAALSAPPARGPT